MDLGDSENKNVDWIQVVQVRVELWALVNRVMNLHIGSVMNISVP
jgi:hypothetical protein